MQTLINADLQKVVEAESFCEETVRWGAQDAGKWGISWGLESKPQSNGLKQNTSGSLRLAYREFLSFAQQCFAEQELRKTIKVFELVCPRQHEKPAETLPLRKPQGHFGPLRQGQANQY